MVLEDTEDDDNDSDHEPKTLHLPDGNDSNDSDNEIDDKLKGSNEDEEYSDKDEDEDEWMLSNKFIGKCNLLNSTICQALFNMGIIWKFQMIHCMKKNVYANKLFKIGIFYHYFICYDSFLGARLSCV